MPVELEAAVVVPVIDAAGGGLRRSRIYHGRTGDGASTVLIASQARKAAQGQRDWIPPRMGPPPMDFLAPRGTFWADSAGNPIGFPYVFV